MSQNSGITHWQPTHRPGSRAHTWLKHFGLPEDVRYHLGVVLMAAQGVSNHYVAGDYLLRPDMESFEDLAMTLDSLGKALQREGWDEGDAR